jgi:hypothetical protein
MGENIVVTSKLKQFPVFTQQAPKSKLQISRLMFFDR